MKESGPPTRETLKSNHGGGDRDLGRCQQQNGSQIAVLGPKWAGPPPGKGKGRGKGGGGRGIERSFRVPDEANTFTSKNHMSTTRANMRECMCDMREGEVPMTCKQR